MIILSFLTGCTAGSGHLSDIPAAVQPSGISSTKKSEQTTIIIYSPMSTSSIPVIMAAERFEDVRVELYTNQSQANAIFLRQETPLLVTGLSVGIDMYRNGVPVKAVNSFVTGLSYLVTSDITITQLSDLRGKSIYIPFEGSPIEEVTRFLTASEGLVWHKDIQVIYSPFESSTELLKQGKAEVVVLPEPSVTLVEGLPGVTVSLDLSKEWDRVTNGRNGYPQVATFADSTWALEHDTFINEFNDALAQAIKTIQTDPQGAVEQVKYRYKLPPEKILKSLSRTRYQFTTGSDLESSIESYYEIIGSPLDESYKDLYFHTVH
jgi:NitT/TauT family transport system substrate-binding protein